MLFTVHTCVTQHRQLRSALQPPLPPLCLQPPSFHPPPSCLSLPAAPRSLYLPQPLTLPRPHLQAGECANHDGARVPLSPQAERAPPPSAPYLPHPCLSTPRPSPSPSHLQSCECANHDGARVRHCPPKAHMRPSPAHISPTPLPLHISHTPVFPPVALPQAPLCRPTCSPVSVPIMMMRRPRPRVNRLYQPICLMMSPAVAPFWAFNLDTRLSAGSSSRQAGRGTQVRMSMCST
jgi:hypothetical protein